MSVRWMPLDHDAPTSPYEEALGTRLSNLLDASNTDMVQHTLLDERAQPSTTVTVVRRPGENLLIAIRGDRSVVVATDEWNAMRYRG